MKSDDAQDERGMLTKCPACGSDLLPGAVACMDCGFLIQSEAAATESEAPPTLCPNPACGVANPPGEKNCVRCSTPLPIGSGTLLQNRYRIEKLLAMGGFGAVYLASDTKNNNRPVAVKDMICADPQEFAIRLNFFRREAEILRSLEVIPIVPRVFDFIEQDHGIGAAPDGFRKLAALFVADITRRRADQPRSGEFFHVLRHVDLNQRVAIAKHEFGQFLGEKRFTHAGGSEENERADWTPRILQVGPAAAERF